MVSNAAAQALRQADELKLKVQKHNGNAAIIQDKALWLTQQELQKAYQRVLVLDLDYALDKKVEQDLWTIGFKNQIEALQLITRDRKNVRRSEAQALLSWILQAAAGFYLCLLHQICTIFKLDLPFRRRASIFGEVVCLGSELTSKVKHPAPSSCRYICQHCLVHLGDLARYRHQLRVADSFYRHALAVSTSSGQPYNQLALLEASRGDRLATLYYHARSLAVRAPFPPARGNLSRTLAVAASSMSSAMSTDSNKNDAEVSLSTPISSLLSGEKISSHHYITELLRFHHLLNTNERLDIASHLVASLTSTLTALVGTDSFDSATIIKMTCINMFAATGGLHDDGDLPKDDKRRLLALQLAGGQLAALLLPARAPLLSYVGLPSVKILLEWIRQSPSLLDEPAFVSKLQLWPALCKLLNDLQTELGDFNIGKEKSSSLPLPEDEELHGFLPIAKAFAGLKFTNLATPDVFGYNITKIINTEEEKDSKACPLKEEVVMPPCEDPRKEPELMNKLRASRILDLGKVIAESQTQQKCQFFTVSVTDNVTTYSHVENALKSNPELLKAIEMLKITPGDQDLKSSSSSSSMGDTANDSETSSDAGAVGEGDETVDEKVVLLTPVVISEADFREKVRERRVGILKPQGSLERAREERALAASAPPLAESNITSTDKVDDVSVTAIEKDEDTPTKKEGKRGRMNVAMQAIMRKQEEINKQVKFITPASTPESTVDNQESSQKEEDKLKIIQPKAIKSLANIPLDRKTGGILSLKDKSAGYPHLVNNEPEKSEMQSQDVVPEATAVKNTVNKEYGTVFGHQYPNFVPKDLTTAPVPTVQWSDPQFQPPKSPYQGFNQKSFGYGPNLNPQGGLRLPVVNPKEIDVRSAALQKQNSRSDQPFGSERPGQLQNQHWQGDKLVFMNDLPPRFANQFRNNAANVPVNMPNAWPARENQQEIDRKYGDNLFSPQVNIPTSWEPPSGLSETPPQPPSWWKDKPPTNFNPNPNYPPPDVTSPPYYMQGATNMYPHLNSYNAGRGFLQGYMGGAPSLQNVISSPNFSATMNNFSGYGQNQQAPISYDPSMYPQFGGSPKPNYQNKPPGEMQKEPLGVTQPQYSFPISPMQQNRDESHHSPSFPRPEYGSTQIGSYMGGMGAMQDSGRPPVNMADNLQSGNTYSLFSGGQDSTAWTGASFRNPNASRFPMQQSLWSSPDSLALEKLLEQQRQLKQNPE